MTGGPTPPLFGCCVRSLARHPRLQSPVAAARRWHQVTIQTITASGGGGGGGEVVWEGGLSAAVCAAWPWPWRPPAGTPPQRRVIWLSVQRAASARGAAGRPACHPPAPDVGGREHGPAARGGPRRGQVGERPGRGGAAEAGRAAPPFRAGVGDETASCRQPAVVAAAGVLPGPAVAHRLPPHATCVAVDGRGPGGEPGPPPPPPTPARASWEGHRVSGGANGGQKGPSRGVPAARDDAAGEHRRAVLHRRDERRACNEAS